MIDQMAENKGFIVDVKVSICFPLDDEKICIPTDEGLHLLKNEEIPVCDQRALVNFKSRYPDTTGDQWGWGCIGHYWETNAAEHQGQHRETEHLFCREMVYTFKLCTFAMDFVF